MALLDLLGRRWTLRILWELSQAPGTFRALQVRASQVSSSVLNRRLAELREAGIVELDDAGYRLSAAGVDLMQHIALLRQWTERWSSGDAA